MRVSTLKTMPLSRFQKVRKYVMDEISSHDIDSMLDWEVGEMVVKSI